MILDPIIPEMDGMKCLSEILRINPNAKFVMASGYSESGPASGVVKGGARRFIQKPYETTLDYYS